MDPALRTAATGMAAQQTRSEVIANNLANVNTTAFKRSRANFEDLLYQTVQNGALLGAPESETAPPIQIGRGTHLAAVQRLHTQGPLEQTGRSLDLSIEGEGFFQVELPDGGRAYTRDGSFNISDTGTLVTNNGYVVVPGIRIPSDTTDITISRTGVITALSGQAHESQEVGRIELATFTNPTGLLARGENLYIATPASGEPVCGYPDEDGAGQVLQGYLEGSNVEIVQEMVDMITTMRAYEINSKAIKNSEEMMEIASGMVR